MNNQQRRKELLMDKQEIETTFDMGYFEYNMKLDLYSIEEALLAMENEQCKVKKKQKNKLNRHKINKKFKQKDRQHDKCNYGHRKLKESLKRKAKKKVRYARIGEEEFALKGCSYHKIYEWRWDFE